MLKLFDEIRKVAAVSANVLILSESGSAKTWLLGLTRKVQGASGDGLGRVEKECLKE